MCSIIKLSIFLIFFQLSWSAYGLSGSDNLETWRNTPSSIQLSLCDAMLKKVNAPSVEPFGLCKCISKTAGEGGLDKMSIGEIAASCIILMK